MACKICPRCKESKTLDNFYFCNKNTKHGIIKEALAYCKLCYKIIRKERYLKNPRDIENKRYRDYYKKNKEKINSSKKEYFKIYYREKHRNHVGYRIKQNVSRRIRNALENGKKNKRTEELLGCSIEFLKKHLESRFTSEMSWENYGKWKVGESMKWNIDHIKPCAKFDLTDPEQQKICFHWSNLQPLWELDNCLKNDNYICG